jgi:hypothetical protein
MESLTGTSMRQGASPPLMVRSSRDPNRQCVHANRKFLLLCGSRVLQHLAANDAQLVNC